jgi:hypothetical protein
MSSDSIASSMCETWVAPTTTAFTGGLDSSQLSEIYAGEVDFSAAT